MNKFFTFQTMVLLALLWEGLGFQEMMAVPQAPAEAVPPSGADGLPRPLNAGRFAALAKKSPFTLASSTEENADFAKDLVLVGYARLDGEDFIMVADKTSSRRLMVGRKPEAGAQSMILVSVERDASGDPAKMRARVRKGSEEAVLKYGAEVTQVPVPPASPIPSVNPQVVPNAQNPVPILPGQAPGPGKNPVVRSRRNAIPTLPGK